MFRSNKHSHFKKLEIPITQVAQMLSKTITLVAILFLPTFAFANGPVPNDHSTVHIVFVVPYNTPVSGGMGGGGAGGGGMFAVDDDGTQTKATPRAVVGDMVLPVDEINPISISIDGEFVGHSMTGPDNIKPVFVLPSGLHKFEFSSDKFATKKAELRVIGTGSKQYLIVKLVAPSSKKPETKPNEEQKKAPVVP
jgi:hypothetical protein